MAKLPQHTTHARPPKKLDQLGLGIPETALTPCPEAQTSKQSCSTLLILSLKTQHVSFSSLSLRPPPRSAVSCVPANFLPPPSCVRKCSRLSQSRLVRQKTRHVSILKASARATTSWAWRRKEEQEEEKATSAPQCGQSSCSQVAVPDPRRSKEKKSPLRANISAGSARRERGKHLSGTKRRREKKRRRSNGFEGQKGKARKKSRHRRGVRTMINEEEQKERRVALSRTRVPPHPRTAAYVCMWT